MPGGAWVTGKYSVSSAADVGAANANMAPNSGHRSEAEAADPAAFDLCAARASRLPPLPQRASWLPSLPQGVESFIEGSPVIMQELRYEGYGPSGVALIIDAMTDNPVRTVADVRHALAKHGGNLGTSGSVAFQFKELGEIVLDTKASGGEDKVVELALDAGADDVVTEADASVVLCAPENFESVKKAVVAAGLTPISADIVMRPDNRVAVSGDVEETLAKLLDWLEELDDVQDVYHNAAFSD